jgi:hypothetical protein
VLDWQYTHFEVAMKLITILKRLTADVTFNRTRQGTALRLSNFQRKDIIDEMLFDSCGGYGILRGHATPTVKAWLEERAEGKYRVDECYDTILVHFSRDTDAVMYKLCGPYA